MKEVVGNLWDVDSDAIVITTNGFIKKNGHGVMGAGVAKQALKRWPSLGRMLGNHLRDSGNHVGLAHPERNVNLIFFPVKHAWYRNAEPLLIEQSVRELVKLADRTGLKHIVLPRPGCGNGGLDWADVKPQIEVHLDDRFTVVNLA